MVKTSVEEKELKTLNYDLEIWGLSFQNKDKRSPKTKIGLLEYKGMKNNLYNCSSASASAIGSKH